MKRGKWAAIAMAAIFGSSLLTSERASAVAIVGNQVAPTEWRYDLTFAPLDNYSIFQQFTTITLTGLFGVTSATGPTSTDFPGTLDTINLAWTAELLNGGTTVRWTHDGPGTGNFGDEKHVFGFGVFATGAVDGLVSIATDGIERDISNELPGGGFELDVSATVAGPVARQNVVPSPSTTAVFVAGMLAMGLAGRRRRGIG